MNTSNDRKLLPVETSDAVYAHLLRAHENLSVDESWALNARLILVLINRIGDIDVISDAISAAEAAVRNRETG